MKLPYITTPAFLMATLSLCLIINYIPTNRLAMGAPLSNATATTMSKDYLGSNYTKPLVPSPSAHIPTFSKYYVSNLRVDTFGGWFVYAVWQQNVTEKNSAIFVARSVDGGQNWTSGEPISNISEDATNPHIGAFGDEVYIIWEQKNPNNNDVFWVKSSNGGSTFSDPTNLSNIASTANARDSSLILDKSTGKVIVAWAAGTSGYAHCTRC